MGIPDRNPIGDPFDGFALRFADVDLLARDGLPGATILASGPLIIRYGVQYLGKPHLAIVPGLIALDYGDMLTGEAAWEFLLKRSNLHPRADVLGYRNDGSDDMIPIKFLDLAQPVEVFVYPDAAATTPVAHPQALIAPVDSDIPPRLRQYLSIYPTIKDWESAHE
jgi:hypothetical protein